MTSCKSKADKARSGKAGTLPIEAFIAEKGVLDAAMVVSGSLLASEEVRLYSEVPGQVVAIHFEEGTRVSKGSLLVKLRDDDLQAQLAKLKLNEKLAADDEKRKQQLLAIRGISQEEYDKAQHQVSTLRTDVDLLLAQIAKTEIRAPFNGIVGLRGISVGSFISTNTLIARFIQTDPIKIEFSLPENMAYSLTTGDEVYFTVEGLQGRHPATVYALEPAIDVSTRTMKVRALCRNMSGELKPGSYARVEIPKKAGGEGILLPAQALVPIMDGYVVMMLKAGKVKRTGVELRSRGDSLVEISSGLRPGDTIILTGLNQVKEGQAVKVTRIRKVRGGVK